ncbi:unnamed protein product [Leuciscus chuanchicus]
MTRAGAVMKGCEVALAQRPRSRHHSVQPRRADLRSDLNGCRFFKAPQSVEELITISVLLRGVVRHSQPPYPLLSQPDDGSALAQRSLQAPLPSGNNHSGLSER